MSNYPAGAEHDPRAPWNQDDTLENIVEELTAQVLSEFRNELVDRLIEDTKYCVLDNYVFPDGWEDYRDEVYEAVYEAAYDDITHRWNRYE